jgi:hypothetical protein
MGSGCAWAALRRDEDREVKVKKVHRLWRDEGPQVLRASVRRGGRPPMVLHGHGPELISQALQQFCAGKVGLSYISPG